VLPPHCRLHELEFVTTRAARVRAVRAHLRRDVHWVERFAPAHETPNVLTIWEQMDPCSRTATAGRNGIPHYVRALMTLDAKGVPDLDEGSTPFFAALHTQSRRTLYRAPAWRAGGNDIGPRLRAVRPSWPTITRHLRVLGPAWSGWPAGAAV